MTPAFRIFISCVSCEFKSYREQLRGCLASCGRDIKVQEDFHDGGVTLLEKLDDYIRLCQAMIHLVGNSCGARPQPAEVRALLQRYPALPRDLPELAEDLKGHPSPFTYTQWEAFLAVYHRVDCYIYRADPASKREAGWTEAPGESALQEAHVQRLHALGQDRRMLAFDDARDVALRFLNSVFAHAAALGGAAGPAATQAITWPEPPAQIHYPLANRQAEFETFVQLVTGQIPQHIFLLTGPSDRGKSVLLAQFAQLAYRLGLRCAHAEFKTGLPLVEVLWDLSRDLAPLRFPRFEREQQRGATETLRTAFLQDLDDARQPVLLILDTYEQATEEAKQWIEQRFLPHFRRHDGLRLVLAGKAVPAAEAGRPWSRLAVSRELPPIRDARYWCQYTRDVLGLTAYRDDQIQILVDATAGSPRVLSGLLGNLRPRS